MSWIHLRVLPQTGNPALPPTLSPAQVVALYDYTAARLDELTLHRGDVIQVLFKDNDNWWLGCLPDGKKGYFLASYVADHSMWIHLFIDVTLQHTIWLKFIQTVENVNEGALQCVEGHAASSDGTIERSTPTRVRGLLTLTKTCSVTLGLIFINK